MCLVVGSKILEARIQNWIKFSLFDNTGTFAQHGRQGFVVHWLARLVFGRSTCTTLSVFPHVGISQPMICNALAFLRSFVRSFQSLLE